jgi:hypothetical protein
MVAMANIPNSPFRTTQINIEEYRKLVNESKVFFAREIKVNAKSQIKNVAAKTVQSAPNKLELSFTIKP